MRGLSLLLEASSINWRNRQIHPSCEGASRGIPSLNSPSSTNVTSHTAEEQQEKFSFVDHDEDDELVEEDVTAAVVVQQASASHSSLSPTCKKRKMM